MVDLIPRSVLFGNPERTSPQISPDGGSLAWIAPRFFAGRGDGVLNLYLLFPDEGHGFAKPGNRIRFYTAAERFLAKYLGGRYEEQGPA